MVDGENIVEIHLLAAECGWLSFVAAEDGSRCLTSFTDAGRLISHPMDLFFHWSDHTVFLSFCVIHNIILFNHNSNLIGES